MRKNTTHTFGTGLGAAALALTLGLSATASAQQVEPRQSPAQNQAQPQSPSGQAMDSAKQADRATNQLAAQGKKLVGKDLYGANNEKIGKIDDVVMGPNGQASAVLADIGGFLGIGAKTVSIPMEQLKAGADDRIVASGLTKQQAEALPEYDEKDAQRGPDGRPR